MNNEHNADTHQNPGQTPPPAAAPPGPQQQIPPGQIPPRIPALEPQPKKRLVAVIATVVGLVAISLVILAVILNSLENRRLASFNNLDPEERVKERLAHLEQEPIFSSKHPAGPARVTESRIETSCYSYELPVTDFSKFIEDNPGAPQKDDLPEPTPYIGKVIDGGCNSAVNIGESYDDLSAITVQSLITRLDGEQPMAYLRETFTVLKEEGEIEDIVSLEAVTIAGQPGAKGVIKSYYGLERTFVVVVAPQGEFWSDDGKEIHSYLIVSYTYNELLKASLDTVLNTIEFKSPL